jgi:hypothetical protein
VWIQFVKPTGSVARRRRSRGGPGSAARLAPEVSRLSGEVSCCAEDGVRANSRAVPAVLASAMSNPFRYFNSSPEVIRLIVMM